MPKAPLTGHADLDSLHTLQAVLDMLIWMLCTKLHAVLDMLV